MKKLIITVTIIGICFGAIHAQKLAGGVKVPNATRIKFTSIVFKDADIHAVFTFLADTANVNIVVDPELKKKISLKLENVTWAEVFNMIIDLYDLKAVQKTGYIYILSTSKYWKRKFDELENVKKEREQIQTETRVIRIHNVDARNLATPLKTALSERGDIVVDPTSNSLIINDLPSQFPTILAMIDSLDRMRRQIKISCQILQVDKKYLSEFGINWMASKQDATISASISTDRVADPIGNFTWGIIRAGEFNFDIKLSAMISQDKSRILDEPHVVTMENIQAEINSSVQRAITMLDQAGNTVYQMITASTKLTVTPQIAGGDSIILNLNVERSAFVPGAAQVEITTRSAKTTVAIESGDILVIGGLSGEERMETQSGVPILKDIPLIGSLFRFKSVEKRPYVIVIFLRPEIVS